MKITWLGHSSFLLENSKGLKLLTDPFDDTIGYKVYEGNADIVTISHHHFDHNYTAKIKNNPKIIDAVGFNDTLGVKITGIPSYHDKIKGAKRGQNIIFIFEMDGFRLCHLGDLGHTLSKDDISKIGNIDVLFIPVGGNFTIDGKEAGEIAKNIHSHIVIPMHFKTSAINFPIEGTENFLINMKSGEKVKDCTLEINDKLDEYDVVKILDYKK